MDAKQVRDQGRNFCLTVTIYHSVIMFFKIKHVVIWVHYSVISPLIRHPDLKIRTHAGFVKVLTMFDVSVLVL